MKGPAFEPGVEEDTEVDDLDLNVSVKCPFCPRIFKGFQSDLEEEIFKHLWKVHDDRALQFMIENMYMSDELKSVIFKEMGYEYASWLVDTGMINEGD